MRKEKYITKFGVRYYIELHDAFDAGHTIHIFPTNFSYRDKRVQWMINAINEYFVEEVLINWKEVSDCQYLLNEDDKVIENCYNGLIEYIRAQK